MIPDRKTVLVVEDDRAIRNIIGTILDNHNYNVIAACDGVEGLKSVEKADVVLLDLFLPELSGEEFLKKVRGCGNYVPVVVMSAAGKGPEEMAMLKSFGIVDFLAKPFEKYGLISAVGKAAAVADDMSFVRKATDRLKGFIERQARA